MTTKATKQATPPRTVRQHERARPAHGVAAVGLDAVDDADQEGDQADREGDVARASRSGCVPGHRCRAA